MTNTQDDSREVSAVLARLNARAWGIATGFFFGIGLFLATMFLVLKGGENVGQHLGLLSVFFPGYYVTIPGAFIGFVYGFVVGYAFGRIIGSVYNRLTGPSGRGG